MTDPSTTLLAELMAKRKRCLVQLRELGLRQAELIAGGDTADLLRLCSVKQQLIVALQSLEVQLSPFYNEDPESRTWASPEARARCAGDAEECRRLIQEVMAMEQDGERQMTVRRDEVASQMRSVSAGGRVRQAYQSQV